MKLTNRKKLIKKLDKLAGEYIRLRDNSICGVCGKAVEGANCHVSHIIPRSRGNRLRWDEQNLMVKCYHHHINWWHKHPVEAGLWFAETYPQRWEYLKKEEARGAKKFTIMDLADLRDEYIRKIENYEN